MNALPTVAAETVAGIWVNSCDALTGLVILSGPGGGRQATAMSRQIQQPDVPFGKAIPSADVIFAATSASIDSSLNDFARVVQTL